ncbi:MAG: hypothetical protein FWC91_13090 [Defluviitaleaceae bacterium]|nr:hypothetical protein [Defluviitaleaceae bacterium]
MSRKFYVTTKLFEGGRRLIGILSEANGQYQFEYKVGGKLQEWFLYLDKFPDFKKIYTGEEVEKFIYAFIPRKDGHYANEFLKAANLKEYDVWELLKYVASWQASLSSSPDDIYLYEQLPEGTIVYEELGTV